MRAGNGRGAEAGAAGATIGTGDDSGTAGAAIRSAADRGAGRRREGAFRFRGAADRTLEGSGGTAGALDLAGALVTAGFSGLGETAGAGNFGLRPPALVADRFTGGVASAIRG